MSGERGQASIEAVAGVAVLLLAGLVCLQVLAMGYALTVADGAAEAGAVAAVRGRPVQLALVSDLSGGLAVSSSASASSK